MEHADRAVLAHDPALAASLAMLRGDLAADVDAADDAAAAYARADSLYALAGDAPGSASARQGLGVLLLRGGDPTGAVRMLRAAAVVQREAGDVRAAALTGVLAGAALADGGNAAEALRELRRERFTLHRIGDPVGEAAALSGLADIEQRESRLADAERDFRAGLATLGTRPAPSVATSLHWGLGRTLFRRGDPAGAVRHLELAVNAMETMAARMPAGDHRTSLLGSASDLYAELALVEHARGRDAAAFQVSEQLRARQMRELGPAADRSGSRPASPAPVTQAAVAARLAPNEAFLEYLVTDSLTLLFVITRDSARSIALSTGREALRAAVDFARAAIARGPARTVSEPWAPPMRRLRRILIEPAESAGLLRGVRRLLIAPHAELHYLPFAALMSAGPKPYLVEHYEIAYVPSAAVWLEFGGRQPAAGTSVLAVAPFPASLPGSRDEARAIGKLYGPDASMLVGPAATQQAFTTAVAGRSVIHLATYGVLNRHNPSFSFVAFAPRPGDDGRLTVTDVLGLSFRARLVVLSACETALGSGASADVPAGDDWVGLVRAFLVAGADNVMASLWPIEDRATSLIVPQVYAGLQRGDVTAALAAAQRAALRDPATSAPRHWAALVVVGAGRPGPQGTSSATAP
jgi:CHAT domain-containing protein